MASSSASTFSEAFSLPLSTVTSTIPALTEIHRARGPGSTMPNATPHSLSTRTSWEFTKWDRVDTIGFLVCCAVSGAILALFALLSQAEEKATVRASLRQLEDYEVESVREKELLAPIREALSR